MRTKLPPFQPRGIEPVHAALFTQMKGQAAQIALGAENIGKAAHFLGFDRHSIYRGARGQQGCVDTHGWWNWDSPRAFRPIQPVALSAAAWSNMGAAHAPPDRKTLPTAGSPQRP